MQLGLFLPKSVPPDVINTLNDICKTRIANSNAFSEYASSSGAEINIASGPEAQARVWPSIQDTAWIFYDSGMVKISPDALGIPRK